MNQNEIKVIVSDGSFGGYEETRTINTAEDLTALRNEFKKFPQNRNNSTTIIFNGFFNGEAYFEQIL